MAKVSGNKGVTPLDNTFRGFFPSNQEDVIQRYKELESADNPEVEVGTIQTRGNNSAMIPIRNKTKR